MYSFQQWLFYSIHLKFTFNNQQLYLCIVLSKMGFQVGVGSNGLRSAILVYPHGLPRAWKLVVHKVFAQQMLHHSTQT
jgi:hypothetical protein